MTLITVRSKKVWSLAIGSLAAAGLTLGPTVPIPAAQAATKRCGTKISPSKRPVLFYSDHGSCVRVAQQDLLNHGVSVGSSGVDGSFGPATRRAVLKFQGQSGLKRDAIVGPHTWRALAKPGSSKKPPPNTPKGCQPRHVIRYGSHGTCVRVAQSLLNKHDAKLVIDGSFGPATRSATLRYQRSAGLVQDGVIGPHTWASLDGKKVESTYSVFYGPNYTNRVVLTFDDCPRSLSQLRDVSRYAHNHNIGLVLAPTGNCVASGRFKASIPRRYGQYVINHSISHPALTTLSYSQIVHQLGKPGIVTNYGRPPYGDGFFTHPYNQKVVRAYNAVGMHPWLWTVDSNDWRGKSKAQVVNYVVNHANARDTVLMHMSWNAFHPSAVKQMVAGLKRRGLNVCRAYPGTTPRLLPSHLPC